MAKTKLKKPASAAKSGPRPAKDVIMEDFDRELEESFKYIEEKLAGAFGGPLGRLVRKVADELFSWFIKVGGTERGRKSFEMILDQAAKVGDHNLESVIEKSLDAYLKLNDLFIRANKSHPAIERFKRALRDEYEARLKIYGPLMKGSGETYGDLVRGVFPNEKTLRDLMDKQFEGTEKVLDMLQKEDGLIKIPSIIKNPVLKIVRTSYSFMRARIEKGTDRIYGQ